MWFFHKEADVADIVFAFTQRGVTRQTLDQTEEVRRIIGAHRTAVFDAGVDDALHKRCAGTDVAVSCCQDNYRVYFRRQ